MSRDVVFFDPTVQPHAQCKVSSDICENLVDQLWGNCRATTRIKAIVAVASLLKAVQDIVRSKTKHYLAIPADTHAFTNRSRVGHRVVTKMREGLIAKGYIELASGGFNDREWGFNKITRYKPTPKLIDIAMSPSLRFQDDHFDMHPLIRSEIKNEGQKNERKGVKLVEDETKLDEFKKVEGVIKMNPLNINGSEYYRCHRSWSSEDLTRGGRYYGHWTTVPKEVRLQSKIKGYPVVEIDLTAAFLTFLAAYTGDIPQAWRERPSDDPYGALPEINDRETAKGMIVRMIGSGNPYKRAGEADFDAGMATCSWKSEKENGPAFYAANYLYRTRMESIRDAFPQVMHLKRGVIDERQPSWPPTSAKMAGGPRRREGVARP